MVDVKDVEFALTIAAIPVTIVILIMAGYFTRKESLSGMIAIIVSIPGLKGSKAVIANSARLRSFTLEGWPIFSSSSSGCINTP